MDKRGMLLLALLLALLAVAALAPAAAMAQGTGILINETTFPDKAFREYVKINFDQDGDGALSPEEIAEVKQIDVSNKDIADLTGVGYFTALETLDCSGNDLTALDLSSNKALKYLDCSSQSPELEVPRNDNGWSVDLSQLGWWSKATGVSVDPSASFQNPTVSWTDGKVSPSVTYNYPTNYNGQTMSVNLKLLPQDVGTWAEVQELVVRDVTAFIWGNQITVGLPADSSMPTADEIKITTSSHATVSGLETGDGGKTWTFTVTSEDGKRKQEYTLSILTAYAVNLLVEGEGTVSAEKIAWKGKTVTLTATAKTGYVFDGWKISPDTITISNNAFEMPDGPVTVTGVFKPSGYRVTLHPCGGTIAAGKDVTSYSYRVGVALPGAEDITREGYTFAGWYDNEALTGDPVAAITSDDEGDKEYWAGWDLIPGYEPVFTLPDGPQEVTVESGLQATLITTAARADSYQWYIDRGDGQGYVAISGATAPTYTTGAVTLENDGYTYYCEAANVYATARSPVFTLRVSEAAVPPQTGDHSHTGLWLMLMLASLGGLCALALNRRRRSGNR